MKLLFSILVLTLLGTCFTQTREGYTPMAPEDYTNNTLIESLRDVGISFLLQRAYDNGRIANQNFTINNTNYILNMTTETMWYYDMNISLVNAQSDSFEAAFIIWYFPENETNRVAAQTYTIEYGPASAANNPNSTYIPVPEEEYETDLIQSLANFGKDFIVDILVAADRIPAGEYNVTNINNVVREVVTTGANYQFDINFAQADGSNEVHAEFRERYENATGNMTVTAHRFAVLDELLGVGNTAPVTTPVDTTGTPIDATTTPTDETTTPIDPTATPTDATDTTTDPDATSDAAISGEEWTEVAPVDAPTTDASDIPTDTTVAPTDASAEDIAAVASDPASTDIDGAVSPA